MIGKDLVFHGAHSDRFPEESENARTIDQIMHYLMLNGARMTASIPGVEGQFATMAMDIATNDPVLVVDELTPAYGHRQLLLNGVLDLQASFHGVNVGFRSQLLDVVHGGTAYYALSYPQRVHFAQHRTQTRVPIDREQVISAYTKFARGESQIGHLADLSPGGMSLCFDRPVEVAVNEQIPELVLRTPDQRNLVCQAQVRHVQANRRQRRSCIGVRLEGLTPEHQQQMHRIMREMERSLLMRLGDLYFDL